MLDKYKYSDKEIKEIIDSMVILVDSREKSNMHVTEWFNKKGIKWKKKALEFGDYSFIIPKNEELSIPRDLDFSHDIMVERKSGLTELSGNLTKDRSRIEKELALAPSNKTILIENASFHDIATGNYDTKYDRKAFMASLFTFWFRYNVPIFFMPNAEETGLFLRLYFEYFLKSKILK